MMMRYVAVCNAAILKNAGRFPFKQILSAAERHDGGRKVAACVKGRCEQPYILVLKNGAIEIVHGLYTDEYLDVCDTVWHVSRDYLDDVVSHADQYIDNPARLDWEWLYKKGE